MKIFYGVQSRFYGVRCDYNFPPVRRRIVEFVGNTIPKDECNDFFSITWFPRYEDALWFLHELEKR